MAIFYILLIITFALSCLFVALQNEKQPLLSLFLKGIASISVICLGLYASFKSNLLDSSIGLLFVIGLVFCLFGDVLLALLEFKQADKYHIINSGSISFALAHLFFVIAMILLIPGNGLYVAFCFLFAILMVGVIYLIQKPIKLNYSKSTLVILCYTFMLSTSLAISFASMLIKGFNSFNIVLFCGFVLFFVSDLILSLIYFKENTKRSLYYYNLGTYYSAIILIASSFVLF